MASIDDLISNTGFTIASGERVTFLPEPPRQERKYTVISVDDHLVEPPDAFEGRMPKHLEERGPRIVDTGSAHVWTYDGNEFPNVGFNAVVGRPVLEYSFEPNRYEHMRRGAYDVHERVADMDLSGIYASLCFPSFLPGFAGQRIQLTTSDSELSLATVRAWNDWNIEAWSGAYPERFIPCQLPVLHDADVAAAEIYANAERGYKAVTFSENPHLLGLPSLHSGYWELFMRACAETETVVNLHIGSSGTSPTTSPDAPPDVTGVLFFGYAMFAAVDWLYSKIPIRHPEIKIVMSEGGIGWVPALLDRLDHMLSYHEMYGTWKGIDLTPAEVLKRNFWFCAVEDPSTFALRDRIGVENIFVEQDYPHCDSTWPKTQAVLEHELGGLPEDDIRKMTWQNASNVYRHPVPEAVRDDPDAF